MRAELVCCIEATCTNISRGLYAMLMAPPNPSPYDWTFRFFQFPVRVHWSFWLIAAAWGYNQAESLDNNYFQLSKLPVDQAVEASTQYHTPGMAALLILWMAAMFLSIFVHELGHCLAFSWFGIPSRILLYHTGGLAIPDGITSWRGARIRRPSAWNDLIISAAGPAAQLLLAGLFIGVTIALGYSPGSLVHYYLLKWEWVEPYALKLPSNAAVMAIIEFTIYPSILWALLNLIPVLPLDGGRIATSLFAMYSKTTTRGEYEATITSVVVGGIVGVWALQSDDRFLGLMFIILAISNFQSLQSQGQRW